MADYKITSYGDAAICITFSEVFTEKDWMKAHTLATKLREENYDWMLSIIPTYTSVIIHYSIMVMDKESVIEIIKDIINQPDSELAIRQRDTHFLPVVYGGEFGHDLPVIAKRLKLTEEEIIQMHLRSTSQLLSFASPAGQPLMGKSDIPDTIPRMETPYVKIPKGTIAIVGSQTTIYTKETPGGWRLIGRTPLQVTYPEKIPPSPFKIGDFIRFFRIDEKEWDFYKNKNLEDMPDLLEEKNE
ncbi:5-oxoprolinase subunit B family protein [Oceanobacillus jeddahense]|uniref:Allophanate hydrolase subunit 1 n=1 Tax=Oceanobacillus jeddahense TaxID=1462527 RepID=A0ABY5K0B7_9BACI|nr:carboxyltransferase domain-containing protein [Oceanobacillus jeddahense]UUI04537.1 allophanate hydrolase subunit 1 [Oceanobacillus jeddahense]